MKAQDKMSIRGIFKLTVIDNVTGDVLDNYVDDNIVLDQGKDLIFKALTVVDTNNYKLSNLKLGTDIGDGTELIPEPPTADLTEADQDVLYTVNPANVTITYPTTNSVMLSTTINGAVVMPLFPAEVNVTYTSAVLYTLGNQAIAYKRFPARTISSLISIDISWTLILN